AFREGVLYRSDAYSIRVSQPDPRSVTDNSKVFLVQHKDDSTLRYYTWDEATNFITGPVDIAHPTIPTQGGTNVWYGKFDDRIIGATRRGSELWVAWTGARTDAAGSNNWFQTHVELAVINTARTTLRMRYLWTSGQAV